MEDIAARFRHYADLAAGTRAELRRVVARFHAKLLNGLKARLQAEPGRDLAVQVAGRCVEDRSRLDSVYTNGVLLIGPAAETNVVERTAAGGLRAGSKKIEL